MGRLPSTYENKMIQTRFPYTMTGEIVMTSGLSGLQYPEATFQNNINKPFEVHRMIPRVYAQLNGVMKDASLQPGQDLTLALIRAKLIDLGLNQDLNKTPTLLSTMVKGTSEQTWEWADPHYLPNNTQLQITLDALGFPFDAQVINQLKVVLTFEGFLVVVGPPIA